MVCSMVITCLGKAFQKPLNFLAALFANLPYDRLPVIMKPSHFIPPALALAGSAYWLYHQNDSIRELTEKTRVIRERVVLFEKASAGATVTLNSSKDGNEHEEFTLPDGSLDWKLIAEMMAETRGNRGMPSNIKAMLKLQQKMMELTEDEIADGLEKISALDLEPSVADMIKQSLLSQLGEKNPKAALAALGDPITKQSDSLFWTQKQIFGKVAKEDPAAATTWLDKNIKDGKLESTSLNHHQDIRLSLEGTLINQLISSDYAAAKSRLDAFSTEEKSNILSSTPQGLNGDGAGNFLKLARESLPPEEASQTITNSLGSTYYDDLSKISKDIKNIPLSGTEKSKVVERLASNYSANSNSKSKFDDIYQWSKTESPGQEATIVANALSNDQNRLNDPQSGLKKALTVSESLGDSDILTSFVSKFSSEGNEMTVERQLEKFKDPALAEKYRALVEALPKDSSDSE